MSRQETEQFQKAVLEHIADREGIRAAILKPAKEQRSVRMPKKRTLAILIAAAMLLLASTAYAAGSWLARKDYTTDTYMMQTQQERTKTENAIPDIEAAIVKAAPKDVSYTVRLLPELQNGETLAAKREEHGQPAFSEQDWGWLKDIRPAINEVLVHGDRLLWTVRLYTDHAAAFDYFSDAAGQHLEAMVDNDVYYQVEGDDRIFPLFNDTSGMNPYELDRNSGLTIAECDIDDSFPTAGRITVTEQIHLLDCSVDDMNPNIADVAVITHTFTFDASAAKPTAEPVRLEMPLTGTYWMTATENYFWRNKQICLDGEALGVKVDYMPTGVYLRLSQNMLSEAGSLYGGEGQQGITVTYTVDGQSYPAYGDFNQNGSVWLLPVFPSDYAAIGKLEVTFTLNCIVGKGSEPPRDDWSFDWSANDSLGRVQIKSQPLGTLTIPLPEQ